MAVTNFIPQVWSARLLAHLDKAHLRPGAVPRGLGGGGGGRGGPAAAAPPAPGRVEPRRPSCPRS